MASSIYYNKNELYRNGVKLTSRRNLSSTRDPNSTDDITLGYDKGSLWLNQDTENFFFCLDGKENNAVWERGSGGELYDNIIRSQDEFEHYFGNYSTVGKTAAGYDAYAPDGGPASELTVVLPEEEKFFIHDGDYTLKTKIILRRGDRIDQENAHITYDNEFAGFEVYNNSNLPVYAYGESSLKVNQENFYRSSKVYDTSSGMFFQVSEGSSIMGFSGEKPSLNDRYTVMSSDKNVNSGVLDNYVFASNINGYSLSEYSNNAYIAYLDGSKAIRYKYVAYGDGTCLQGWDRLVDDTDSYLDVKTYRYDSPSVHRQIIVARTDGLTSRYFVSTNDYSTKQGPVAFTNPAELSDSMVGFGVYADESRLYVNGLIGSTVKMFDASWGTNQYNIGQSLVYSFGSHIDNEQIDVIGYQGAVYSTYYNSASGILNVLKGDSVISSSLEGGMYSKFALTENGTTLRCAYSGSSGTAIDMAKLDSGMFKFEGEAFSGGNVGNIDFKVNSENMFDNRELLQMVVEKSSTEPLSPKTVYASVETHSIAVAPLDDGSGNILIAYRDKTDNYGRFVITDSTGSAIIGPVTFNAESTQAISATSLGNGLGKTLIAYHKASAVPVIIIVSGAGSIVVSEVSFGDANTWFTSSTNFGDGSGKTLVQYASTGSAQNRIAIFNESGGIVTDQNAGINLVTHGAATALNDGSGNVMVTYFDGGPKQLRIGVYNDIGGTIVSDTSIYTDGTGTPAFISANSFNDGSGKVLISFESPVDSAYGVFLIVNSSGSVVVSKTVFKAATVNWVSSAPIASDRMIVAYSDAGNSDYGTYVSINAAGTVGDEVVFNDVSTGEISLSKAYNDIGRVFIAYDDDGGSNNGTLRVLSSRASFDFVQSTDNAATWTSRNFESAFAHSFRNFISTMTNDHVWVTNDLRLDKHHYDNELVVDRTLQAGATDVIVGDDVQGNIDLNLSVSKGETPISQYGDVGTFWYPTGSAETVDGYMYHISQGIAVIYRYDIEQDYWAAFSTDFTSASGLAMTYGNDGYLYVFQGSSQSFLRYRISDGSWETLADFGYTVGLGSDLTCGDDGYIYGMRGGAQKNFRRYSVENDAWSDIADPPVSFSGTGASITYGGDGYIYAMDGTASAAFYKYDMAEDSWETAESLLNAAGNGCSIDADGLGYVYFFKLNFSVANILVDEYDIRTGVWRNLYTVSDLPYGTPRSVIMYYDRFVYVILTHSVSADSSMHRYKVHNDGTIIDVSNSADSRYRLKVNNLNRQLHFIYGDGKTFANTLELNAGISNGTPHYFEGVNGCAVKMSNMKSLFRNFRDCKNLVVKGIIDGVSTFGTGDFDE